MGSRRFLVWPGFVAAAFALGLPVSAHASTASVEEVGGPGPGSANPVMLRYTADPGEANAPTFTFQAGNKAVTIADRVPITPGNGCAQLAPTTVICESSTTSLQSSLPDPNADSFMGITVALGDGDDLLNYQGQDLPPLATVDAGAGNDVVATGDSEDSLLGGPGDDRLSGGGGLDTLVGGTGADDLRGGGYIDIAWYRSPSEPDVPRTFSLDDVANDGAKGEGDNIHSDVEWVDAAFTSSRHTFIGNDGNNSFFAGSGGDAMEGLGGNDVFYGGSGADKMDGGGGRDMFWAGAGDDLLKARDGEADYGFECGAGIDQLVADVIDPVGRDCEQDNRG